MQELTEKQRAGLHARAQACYDLQQELIKRVQDLRDACDILCPGPDPRLSAEELLQQQYPGALAQRSAIQRLFIWLLIHSHEWYTGFSSGIVLMSRRCQTCYIPLYLGGLADDIYKFAPSKLLGEGVINSHLLSQCMQVAKQHPKVEGS